MSSPQSVWLPARSTVWADTDILAGVSHYVAAQAGDLRALRCLEATVTAVTAVTVRTLQVERERRGCERERERGEGG